VTSNSGAPQPSCFAASIIEMVAMVASTCFDLTAPSMVTKSPSPRTVTLSFTPARSAM
jgi:hypothetical protein